MDVGALATLVIPALTALTGLVSAIAALVSSRSEVRKIGAEAVRTGVGATPDTTELAVHLALELSRVRDELGRLKH